MNTSRTALAAILCAALTLPVLAQTATQMPAGGSGAAAGALAIGTIKHIDATQHLLTIDHQAIPSMNMPSMTMEFRLDKGRPLDGLSVGQSIAFTFNRSGDALSISEVQPIRVSAAAPSAPTPDHEMPGSGMPGMNMSGMDMSGMDKEMMAKCHEMMMKHK
ncbi:MULTISPECIES: copper-binding protein [Variovorax]|jgi:Cu/Ag efflux protein CusF|uniref:copper-binding protein n=1 Tax=Variovorax sp. 3P27G3 TaxID=2502214 RepID=UPI001485BD6C|nr:copper-binding protein [Variovorax sp. 3P27G3]